MSDYCKIKCIRCRITDKNFSEYGIDDEDTYELVSRIIEKYPNETYIEKIGAAPTEGAYIDLVLDTNFPADCGDYGYCKPLTHAELELYYPLFKKILNVEPWELCNVEYCWYNCCEAPDYYETYETEFKLNECQLTGEETDLLLEYFKGYKGDSEIKKSILNKLKLQKELSSIKPN